MGQEYSLDTSLAREVADLLDPFTLAYIEAMFWTLTDEDGHSMDYLGLHDLSAEGLAKAREDCAGFQRTAAALLEGSDDSQAGHDFWLTRNGHGAGFWDRSKGTYPADLGGRALTHLAKIEGNCDAYVGDDGNVYLM